MGEGSKTTGRGIVTIALTAVLVMGGGFGAAVGGFDVGRVTAAQSVSSVSQASGAAATPTPQPWVAPKASATPTPAATLPPGSPQSLSIAQMTGELLSPDDFTADDWQVDSTTTLSPSDSGDDECFFEFTNIDALAGVTTGVERDLEQASTTHYIVQTLEYSPKSAQVLADETTSLKQCGYSSSYLDDHDNEVVQTSADLDANSVGIKVDVPSLCRSFSDHADAEADDDFSGFYCTVLSGGHIIQVYETTSDNAHPVTAADFASNVNGALALAVP